MKKIAFVMPWLLPMPPVRGGAVETLVDSLLWENEKRGEFEITVFSPQDEQARLEYPKYLRAEFVPIQVPKWQHEAVRLVKGALWKGLRVGMTPGAAYLHAVKRALCEREFDRIILENVAAFAIPIARMDVGPVDLHMHNVATLNEQPHPEQVAGHCRRILCVSDYIRSWCEAHLGNQPEKYRVLLNCIDSPRFSDAGRFRDETRSRLGIGEDEIAFLYTGRLCPEKGALELAEAFRQLNLPNSKLVIVGSTWFDANVEDEYLRRIRSAIEPVKERVIFTGYVHYPEIPRYYALADVAVMPSIWDEPGSLTLLEAQASGLPLITTRSGGNAMNTCPDGAILLERGEGLTDRIAQSMQILARDAARRDQMRRSALEWSRDRTKEAYFRNFCALMDEP